MSDLAHVLRQLPSARDPALLLGEGLGDDAAVYRLSDELALVQTVDFFTPIVDDPYAYGQIAAANSLSDIYAVGGTPITALNLVAFPMGVLPPSVLEEVLRGGTDKAREAGVTIVGGHTVDDPEPKYGLAVTGTVHPERFISTRHGVADDLLVLTKPIGTGLVATALKRDAASVSHVLQATSWMSALNRPASEAMVAAKAGAATDITGFGLLGHLVEMCRASGVAAELRINSVPLLPGTYRYAQDGYVPAGTWTTLAAVKDDVRFGEGIDETWRTILADPQTSGGLMVAINPDRYAGFSEAVGADCLSAIIGTLTTGDPGSVRVTQ